MNVYVESNFVLELALRQEQHASCENILNLAENGRLQVVLPAYCLAEPYETIARSALRRTQLHNEIHHEARQFLRSEHYRGSSEVVTILIGLRSQSIDEEKKRLRGTVTRLLSLAEIIPIGQGILLDALDHQDELGLSPQDALVFSSVSHHLTASLQAPSCFVNRDRRDFDNPDVVSRLAQFNCKLLPRFDTAYEYIVHQIGP